MSEKLSLFDIINNIFEKKERLSDDDMKGYSPFMVNRALSNGLDTIFFAEEMNCNWQLDARMQYDFYYYGIDKKKRFNKWPKKDNELEDKIALIKEYYGYSELRARETIPILDSLDSWDKMKAELYQGGKKK